MQAKNALLYANGEKVVTGHLAPLVEDLHWPYIFGPTERKNGQIFAGGTDEFTFTFDESYGFLENSIM